MALDMVGQKIYEGDYIAYPCRSGSSMWVTISKVVGFSKRYDSWNKDVVYDELKVIRPGSLTNKVSTIVCLDRVLKLHPNNV